MVANNRKEDSPTQEFWTLIETHNLQSEDDSIDLSVLDSALAKLTPDEITSFSRIFDDLHTQSFTTNLWAASSWLYAGKLSEQDFGIFRCWLITQGREAFERYTRNPDSLVEVDVLPRIGDQEAVFRKAVKDAYQSAAGKASRLGKPKAPDQPDDFDFSNHEEMKRRLPRISQRCIGDPPGADKKLLRRCFEIAGIKKREWTDAFQRRFFDRFRPAGHGLRELYSGFKYGDEIAGRLVDIIEVDGTSNGVVQPNNFIPISVRKAKELIKAAFEDALVFGNECRRLCILDSVEKIEVCYTLRKIEVVEAWKNGPARQIDSDSRIETLFRPANYAISRASHSLAVQSLRLAESGLIGYNHVLFYARWPVCKDYFNFRINEPFGHFYELWKHGVEWRLGSNGFVQILVPSSRT